MRSLLPVLTIALLAGGAPDDDFRSERQILRHLTVKLAQFRSEQTETSGLSASVSTLKSLLEQMTAQSADLKFQDGRVHGFEVTDLDPKSNAQARLERDYDARIEELTANAKAFFAANDNKFERGSPEHLAAQAQFEAMVKEINRVTAEKAEKVREAILIYAAAQREYAVLLSRQRELQLALDQSTTEFQSLRGRADTQLHSLESALFQLRRAAGTAGVIDSVTSIPVNRPLGSMVFDTKEGAPPVDLPDVATPEGTPGELVLPIAPSRGANPPQELLNNPKAQALRLEGEALQLRGRQLQVEKVRLFNAKDSTSEEWTAYSRKVQEHARDAALNTIKERGLEGGSELMDLDAMGTKLQKEPPVPGKETPQ